MEAPPNPGPEVPRRLVVCSKHAAERYIERIEGVDVDVARSRIRQCFESTRVTKLVDFAGSATFWLTVGDVTYCVCDGVVVTVYPRGREAATRARRHWSHDGARERRHRRERYRAPHRRRHVRTWRRWRRRRAWRGHRGGTHHG